MQRLEVSGAVRLIYASLDFKGLVGRYITQLSTNASGPGLKWDKLKVDEVRLWT